MIWISLGTVAEKIRRTLEGKQFWYNYYLGKQTERSTMNSVILYIKKNRIKSFIKMAHCII